MSRIFSDDDKGPSPPPAPPLPLQPYTVTSRARSALARFAQPLLYGSRSQKSGRGPPRDARISALAVQRNSSPVSSRSTTHKTGIPIAALDISPLKTHAVVAGREILKTIRITDSKCSEDNNLRAAIIAYAATHATAKGVISATHKDQLAVSDVRWSHGAFDTHIATAAANGQIVIYDIYRPGMELARLHEHKRQVHRLGFNPHQGAWMLSGSQDATIKLWDLRSMLGDRSVITCDSMKTFAGHSDGIRDLRWSPTDGFEFAAGTDSGIIQRWDIRKPNAPLLKISAHDMTCHSIDWHPGGKHLVSGGADKNIKVWDFSSSDRRMKPAWQLKAPQAVINVRWRPAYWSSDGNHLGKWQCTQLATSYDKEDSKIHLWEICRPSVPFRVLDRYDSPPTAFLWHSESLLWSVGSAGMFKQTDINFTPKTMDHRNANLVEIAADGHIFFGSMKKDWRRMSNEGVTDGMLKENHRRSSADGKASGAHGATGGSLEERSTFYSSFKNRTSKNKHLAPTKSTPSLAGRPLTMDANASLEPLEESLRARHIYRPQQVLATGSIPGLFDTDGFKFRARHYKAPPRLPAGALEYDLHLIFLETFQHNARVAAYTGQYRLSQTWEILGQAVKAELERRAQSNRKARIALLNAEPLDDLTLIKTASHEAYSMEASDKVPLTKIESDVLNGNDQPPIDIHVASDMTTPFAGPVADYSDGPSPATTSEKAENSKPSDLSCDGKPPEPLVSSPEPSQTLSPKDQKSDKPLPQDHGEELSIKSETMKIQESDDIAMDRPGSGDVGLNLADQRAAAEKYRAAPRPVLKLDDPFHYSEPNAPSLDPQNSNESLQMFSASTDSSSRAKSDLGSFENGQHIAKSKTSSEHESHISSVADEGDGVYGLTSGTDGRSASEGVSLEVPFEMKEILAQGTVEAASPSPVLRPREKASPIIHIKDAEPLPGSHDPEESAPRDHHRYIESDFFPTIPDDHSANPPPWTATAMLLPLIEYHTQKLFDAQFPTWLFVHVLPYFLVRMHRSTALNVILHYHKKLATFELYVQAAELRLFCMEFYPEVSAYGQYDVDTGGPYCTNCHLGEKKSRNESNVSCDRCHKAFAECSVCEGYGPIGPERTTGIDTVGAPAIINSKAADALWGWCSACGHGGHNGCLQVWWDDPASEGACPTVGCLCDCMPGTRRDEIYKAMELEEKAAVSRDTWNVGESGAVQRARGLVGSAEASKGVGTSILQARRVERGPLALGITGRSASRGKRVRIVVPEDSTKDRDEVKVIQGKGSK